MIESEIATIVEREGFYVDPSLRLYKARGDGSIYSFMLCANFEKYGTESDYVHPRPSERLTARIEALSPDCAPKIRTTLEEALANALDLEEQGFYA